MKTLNKYKTAILAALVVVLAITTVVFATAAKNDKLYTDTQMLDKYGEMKITQDYAVLGLKNPDDIGALVRLEGSNYMVAITKMGFPVIVGVDSTGKMVIMEDIVEKQAALAQMITKQDITDLEKELNKAIEENGSVPSNQEEAPTENTAEDGE